MRKLLATLVALCALSVGGVNSVHAQALLLSFGASNALNPTLNTSTNNPDGLAGGTFNTITGDKTTGFSYSDGSTASGLTLDVGSIQASGGTTFTFNATTTTGTSFNEATGSGIYAAGAPASNSLYVASSYGIGVVIDGLAAGTYNVYVVGVRSAAGTGAVSEADFAQAITQPTFNSGSPVNISSYTQATQANGTSYSPSAFALGSNYQLLPTTLTAGQSLFVGGVNSAGNTSFLNIVEIVPVTVPEPTTWAMLGLGLTALLAGARRKLRARCS